MHGFGFFHRAVVDKISTRHEEKINSLGLVVSRVGLTKRLEGGAYLISHAMLKDLRSGNYGWHPCNVGPAIAYDLGDRYRVKAIIYHSPQELDIDLKERLIQWHGKDHAETFYNQFRRYDGAYGKDIFDLRGLLPLVACPTLVLYPDRSFLFDVEQRVSFYRHLPNGELAVLLKCSHNTYEHQPEEYIRHVLNFLNRHYF